MLLLLTDTDMKHNWLNRNIKRNFEGRWGEMLWHYDADINIVRKAYINVTCHFVWVWHMIIQPYEITYTADVAFENKV